MIFAVYGALFFGVVVGGGVGWIVAADRKRETCEARAQAMLWRKRAEAKEAARFLASDEAANWQQLAHAQSREIQQLRAERDAAIERHARAIETQARRGR